MDSLVISGANVITMAKPGTLTEVDVRIEKGVIREIGPNLCSRDARVVEAGGSFLIPGLIDAHIHLRSKSQLGLMLAHGVTSVRNMSMTSETMPWKDQVAKGELVGPSICTTGLITDGQMFWPGFKIVRTEAEAQQAVLDDISDGYDFVKTYPDIPREAFIKLMETANKHGIRVVGHGSNTVSTQELIDLGYYSLEHVSRLPLVDDEVVLLAQAGMWYVPTLIALHNVVGYIKGGLEIADYAHRDWVEASIIDSWHGSVKVYRSDKRFATFDLDNFARITRLYKEHSDKILLGTDLGVPGTVPGLSSHAELELLVTMGGFSPLDALKAGTVTAARALGKEDQIGTVEVGKVADLLILDANPLELIANSRRIGGVVKSGRYFDGCQLAELVDQCKAMVKNEKR